MDSFMPLLRALLAGESTARATLSETTDPWEFAAAGRLRTAENRNGSSLEAASYEPKGRKALIAGVSRDSQERHAVETRERT